VGCIVFIPLCFDVSTDPTSEATINAVGHEIFHWINNFEAIWELPFIFLALSYMADRERLLKLRIGHVIFEQTATCIYHLSYIRNMLFWLIVPSQFWLLLFYIPWRVEFHIFAMAWIWRLFLLMRHLLAIRSVCWWNCNFLLVDFIAYSSFEILYRSYWSSHDAAPVINSHWTNRKKQRSDIGITPETELVSKQSQIKKL